MIAYLLATLSIVILATECSLLRIRSPIVPGSSESTTLSLQDVPEIDKEKAISIATKARAKVNGQPEQFNVLACEESEFWRIIFDRKGASLGKKDPEYILTKDGRIIDIELVKHQLQITNQNRKVILQRRTGISKEEAIKIAEKDAIAVYKSLKKYDLIVCELSRAWRIIYSLKEPIHGGGPDYVIDKKTGQIIDKNYEQ